MEPSTDKNEIRNAETSEIETRSLSAPNDEPGDDVYEIPYDNHQCVLFEQKFQKKVRKENFLISLNILMFLCGGMICGVSVYFILKTGTMNISRDLESCSQQYQSLNESVSRSFGRLYCITYT